MGFVFVSRSVQGTPLVILQQYTNINIHLSIQTYHVQILIFIFLNLQYTYTNIYLSHTGRKKSYGRRAHENTHRTSYASLHTPRENLATLPSCTQTGLFCHTQASFVILRPLYPVGTTTSTTTTNNNNHNTTTTTTNTNNTRDRDPCI